jgi:[histone H3]-lysine4 N-trimethyltransferase SETD1
MTRQPGPPGFKDFFPASTRAVKDREREKTRPDAAGARATASESDFTGHGTSSDLDRRYEGQASLSRPQANGFPDTAHPLNDDADSVMGDALPAVGSASSHESSSSVFSSSATQQGAGPAAHSHSTSITPLTNIDSPSYRNPILPPKAQSLTPQHAEKPNGAASYTGVTADATSTPLSVLPRVIGRPPARDPARSVKGIRCVYDPFSDRSLSSTDKKDARPRLQPFGLVRTYTIYPSWQRGGVISSIEAIG